MKTAGRTLASYLGRFSAQMVVMLVVVSQVAFTSAQSPPPSAATPPPPEQSASDWEFWSSGRYRLTPGDVLQVAFLYVPEFDQLVSIQPDGYVSLRGVRDVFAQGLTVPQFHRAVTEAYTSVLREPVVSVVLKEFEKPYFVAAGEISRPGKFDLRGATTLTQALAIAGGLTKSAKSSQIVLFRRFANDYLEVKTIDVKKMYGSRDLSEDPLLRPGDTVYVPRSFLSRLAPYIPQASLGFYLDPLRLR